MALSDWDRAYIEHLIRRDEREALALRQFQDELSRAEFMGEGRYYWDIHSWPRPVGAEKHHEVLVTQCPGCNTRLEFSLVPTMVAPLPPSHSHGCEFFRNEQRQWVNDYAELRNDLQAGTRHHGYSAKPLVRPLSETEQAILWMLTRGQVHGSCYMMSVSVLDYQMVRKIIEVPDPSTPHVRA